MRESLPLMIPRDIITPSATLLGLIVTALGILVAVAGEPEQLIVRNFAFLFIAVVGLFVFTVILTVASSLLRKIKLWNYALILYIAGWAFLGTILILTLIGYAYGIEILQLQLPQFNLELVSYVAVVVSIIAAFIPLLKYLTKWRELVKDIREKTAELSPMVKVTQKEFDEAFAELRYASLGVTDSLVLLRSDIERELRGLAASLQIKVVRPYSIRKVVIALETRGILNPELAHAILLVYSICSKVVHGLDLSKGDSYAARELGIKTLVKLRELSEKYEKQ